VPRPPISPELRETARQLASREIAYVVHPQFSSRGAERWLATLRPADPPAATNAVRPAVGVAFVSGFVQAPLLTPDEEQYFFLQMNYLKFKAERLRRRIDPEHPDADMVASVQQLLTEAERLRNRIAESNLRLVVAVAKKLSQSFDHLSELVSEGVIPLLRAVELFDVHRGFRFSTYATWAVRNQMLRMLRRQQTARETYSGDVESSCDTLLDRRSSEPADVPPTTDHREVLSQLLGQLSERERQILDRRFGLNGQPSGQSLSEISSQIGLSKERVRQLVINAIDKMRLSAARAEVPLPESWTWALEG
jgi:RNA polymerase sigma factor (sigma-70 family)